MSSNINSSSMNSMILIQIKRIIFIIFLTGVSNSLSSQSIVIPPSPNAASYASGIQNHLNQYTGKADVQIPIYTIEAGRISIPISLSYNTDGIKVSEIAAWCGLGWTLHAGGLVSRSAVGFPDETPDIGYNAYYITQDDPIAETQSYTKGTTGNTAHKRFAIGEADGTPDQYYYSIPSSSGKIKNSWHSGYTVQSKEYMKVSNTVRQQSFGTWANSVNYASFCGNSFNGSSPKTIDEWTLRDGYGNTYSFGEKEQMSSHTFTVNSGSNVYHPYTSTDTCYKVVNTWYLTSVTPPNGNADNMVTFEYDSSILTYDLPSGISLMSRESGPQYPLLGGMTDTRILQTVLSKRLRSIRFPGGVVRFVPTTSDRADLINDKALDRIIVENEKGDTVRQFVFKYKYLIGNQMCRFDSVYTAAGSGLIYYWTSYFPESHFNGRLILESITEQDREGNSINRGIDFNYIHDKGLPERGSRSTDYWGFYNGYNGNPIANNPTKGVELVPGSKEPNILYAVQGSLKKINYPTGSSTYFSYDTKSARFPDYIGGGFLPYYSTAGGLNVVSIVTSDSLTGQQYSITNNYKDGVANSTPYNERIITIGDQTYKVISLSSFYPLTSTQGSTVGYGKVTELQLEYEIRNEDRIQKGKTEYYFTNPETFPDEFYSIGSSSIYYPGAPIHDMDWKRGLLKEKKVYSVIDPLIGDYTLKKKIINEYDYIEDTLGKAFCGVTYTHYSDPNNNTYRLIPYRVHAGRAQLTSELETTYEDQQEITKVSHFYYNRRNFLPSLINFFVPYSQLIQKMQTYAADFTRSDYSLYPSLPVEQLTMWYGPDKFVITDGVLNNYDPYGNISSVLELNKDTIVTNVQDFKLANLPGGAIPDWINTPVGYFQPDRRYREALTMEREPLKGGALRQQKSFDGTEQTFIWGYTRDHAQYPVAVITGSSYEIASEIIDQALLDSAIYHSDARIRIELNKLRVNLPDAHIITYTYAPLVGMTSATDENGIATYYEYDNFGRLIMIRDDQFNILKQVCYGQTGVPEDCLQTYFYSEEVSASFTQVGCDGTPGTSVVYKVPVAAYFSTVSQADANGKAIDDLNENGQAYANSLRTCPLYFNVESAQNFTRNDCLGESGETVTYKVPEKKYASLLSQQDADQKALNDISENGQNYANKQGTCSLISPFARLRTKNTYTDWNTGSTYADISVEFFEDQGCTIPYPVNDLTLYIAISSDFSDNTYDYTYSYLEFNCTGSSQIILPNFLLAGYDPDTNKTVTNRTVLFPPVGDYIGLNEFDK